jgi:hypothetical protein
MNESTITISKKEYRKLLKANEWKLRLEGGGVDNWDWYGESLNSEYADEEWSEFCDRIDEEYKD